MDIYNWIYIHFIIEYNIFNIKLNIFKVFYIRYIYICIAEKRIISKLLEISIPNFDSINWRLEWRLFPYFTFISFILSEKYVVKERYGIYIFLYLIYSIELNTYVFVKSTCCVFNLIDACKKDLQIAKIGTLVLLCNYFI